jgi:hypothetical protein
VDSRGVRTGPPEVLDALRRGEPRDPDDYYFRTAVTLEAGPGDYEWVNRALFVAIAATARLAWPSVGLAVEGFTGKSSFQAALIAAAAMWWSRASSKARHVWARGVRLVMSSGSAGSSWARPGVRMRL